MKPESPAWTIGKLAERAGVGVETVRFYERKGLIQQPKSSGTYRQYPKETLERIFFIKRAQTLGFSLEDIGGLLSLQDGVNRKAIQEISSKRLEDIRIKIKDLQAMEAVLATVLHDCKHGKGARKCPIIKAIQPEGISGC